MFEKFTVMRWSADDVSIAVIVPGPNLGCSIFIPVVNSDDWCIVNPPAVSAWRVVAAVWLRHIGVGELVVFGSREIVE